jgi:hypothetical protein
MANKNFFKWLSTKRFDLDGAEVTATAAELNKLAGNTVLAADLTKLHGITSSKEEINVLDGGCNGAPGFVVGAETGGNTINVGIQLNDANGSPTAMRQGVFAYLSNDANGDSIATAAPSGGWAIGTDGLLIPVVAGKAAELISEADGDIDINIIEAGAATWYLILKLPSGKLASSTAITFAG